MKDPVDAGGAYTPRAALPAGLVARHHRTEQPARAVNVRH